MEIICYSRSEVRSEHCLCTDPWAVRSPTHRRSFGPRTSTHTARPDETTRLPARFAYRDPFSVAVAETTDGAPIERVRSVVLHITTSTRFGVSPVTE